MMTVLTYRPEFVPPWPMHSHMLPITLNRLERPEVEALITLHRNGMRFMEIPVEMNSRQAGKSSIGAKNAVYYMLKVTLAIFVAIIKRRQR